MNGRGRWQGMLAIARFNWPVFVVALVGVLVCAGAEVGWLRVCGALGLAGALYFLLGSLGVSHFIYDRSDLYRWGWTRRALKGAAPGRMVFCHSGFDEASAALKGNLPAVEWVVLDHFDEETMTEGSIRRARRMFPPVEGTVAARYDSWPVESGSAAVVWGLLAIHELRSEGERGAWFAEAKRVLGADGRVILAEHVRDAANFIAFGPGFLHFHSPAGWRRCWERAGFAREDEFRVSVRAGVCVAGGMTEFLTVLLRVAGAGLIFLAILHVPISRRLKWREDEARMTPANAAIFRVHAFFICLVLVLMGLPCLLEPRVFLTESRAGGWISWSFSAFWAIRLYFQWFVYPRDLWRGKGLETALHFWFTLVWAALACLFAACGLWQAGWFR